MHCKQLKMEFPEEILFLTRTILTQLETCCWHCCLSILDKPLGCHSSIDIPIKASECPLEIREDKFIKENISTKNKITIKKREEENGKLH